jgi:glycosyltransferase involved in cell wall biosynthesis
MMANSNIMWDRYRPQIKPLADKVEMSVLYHHGDYPENYNEKNIKLHQVCFGYPQAIKNKYINFIGRVAKLRSFYGHYKRGFEFLDFIKEYDIDADIVYGLSSSGYFQFNHLQVADGLDLPSVFRLRGLGVEARKYQLSKLMSIIGNTVDIHTSKKYNRYIPINNYFRNALIKRGIDKHKISSPIFNGVDTNSFRFTEYPDDYILGCCSRISEEKGIYFLLELMRKTPDIKYLYIGRKSIDVDFPNNCEYLGLWKHENMYKFYNRCSAILLPSYAEGISNVFLESYACSRIVISSDKAYHPEIKNYGYILPHNINAWIKTIYYLKEHPNIYKKNGELAVKYANNYTWEKYAEKMVREFKVVLE